MKKIALISALVFGVVGAAFSADTAPAAPAATPAAAKKPCTSEQLKSHATDCVKPHKKATKTASAPASTTPAAK